MQLSASQLTLPGALPGPQDPQPFFRAPVQDLDLPHNGAFRPEDLEGYGVGCGALTVLRAPSPTACRTVTPAATSR